MSRATANTVRIIGGQCRGRSIRFPPSSALRPTPDRVRETLFNWLGQDLSGQATLEPYAGTGVMSLEALSRGARLAVAVDRDTRLVSALRANAQTLGLDGLEVVRGEALPCLAREARRFDVIFLDPPYADDPWPDLLPACTERLQPGGAVYAEAGRELTPVAGWAVVRKARAGHVYYHLLRPEP